jgi:hypothetical protein
MCGNDGGIAAESACHVNSRFPVKLRSKKGSGGGRPGFSISNQQSGTINARDFRWRG